MTRVASALKGYAKARVEREFAQAADLGHDANEVHTQHSAPGKQRGQVAKCSCGWESSPRSKNLHAALAAYWHVLEVLDDAKSAAAGRPVKWTPAPRTPVLFAEIVKVAQDTPESLPGNVGGAA